MKFCPACGKPLRTETIEGRDLRLCDCGFVDWDNEVHVCVMTVPFLTDGRFLMVRLKGAEAGKLTFPGGFRNLRESMEDAARRETWEESGHSVGSLRLERVHANDTRRLVWIVYSALVTGGEFVPNDETAGTSFFSLTDLPPFEDLRGPLTREILDDIVDGKIRPAK